MGNGRREAKIHVSSGANLTKLNLKDVPFSHFFSLTKKAKRLNLTVVEKLRQPSVQTCNTS
jgi:hypothetical protein